MKKRMCIFMYILYTHTHTQLGHFAVQQELTKYCKSTIIKIKKNIPLYKIKIKNKEKQVMVK